MQDDFWCYPDTNSNFINPRQIEPNFDNENPYVIYNSSDDDHSETSIASPTTISDSEVSSPESNFSSDDPSSPIQFPVGDALFNFDSDIVIPIKEDCFTDLADFQFDSANDIETLDTIPDVTDINEITPNLPTSETPLDLSREALLKLSSKSLETYAQNLASSRSLTQEEERQLKRQRRLIKNRESAQLSRLRKKMYVEELEKKVSLLNDENKGLKHEVLYLRNIVKQISETGKIPTNIESGNTIPKSHAIQPKNVKATGVCLLIMLFAFGLFFNGNEQSSKRFQFEREDIPEVVQKDGGSSLSSLSGGNGMGHPNPPNGRTLQSINQFIEENDKYYSNPRISEKKRKLSQLYEVSEEEEVSEEVSEEDSSLHQKKKYQKNELLFPSSSNHDQMIGSLNSTQINDIICPQHNSNQLVLKNQIGEHQDSHKNIQENVDIENNNSDSQLSIHTSKETKTNGQNESISSQDNIDKPILAFTVPAHVFDPTLSTDNNQMLNIQCQVLNVTTVI